MTDTNHQAASGEGSPQILSREEQAVLVDFFRSQGGLYGLVDSARNPRIFSLLESARRPPQILFTDHRARTLVGYGPYFVDLTEDTPLLEQLVAHWGESWGIYVTSLVSLSDELFAHFQSLLWAETPEGRFLFRYFDPRVLPVFLSSCDGEEAREFFGPVDTFYAEQEDPRCVSRFRVSDQGTSIHSATIEQLAEYVAMSLESAGGL